MRTKHIVISIVAALLGIALALAAWLHFSPPPPTPAGDESPVDAGLAAPIVDVVDPEPVFGEGEPAAFEASPQGLYDDLDAAFERAGEKPELTLERIEPPTLAPPQSEEPDPA